MVDIFLFIFKLKFTSIILRSSTFHGTKKNTKKDNLGQHFLRYITRNKNRQDTFFRNRFYVSFQGNNSLIFIYPNIQIVILVRLK